MSIVLVAEAGGALVGLLGVMRWGVGGGGVLSTIRGVDLAVDPAHRRRGISMRLIGAARGQYSDDIALGWSNPNEYSRGGVLGSGRRKVGGLPRFVGLGAPLRATLRPAREDSGATPPWLVGDSAAEALENGEWISRLLAQEGSPSDRLTTARDLEFLRWRYGQFEDYRAVVEEGDSGRCAGIAIFRLHRHDRLSVAQICELLVEREDPRTARRLLRQLRRVAGPHSSPVRFDSRRRAARCGFVRSPRGAMITANPLREALVPDPTLPASWALSLGDLELL